MRVLLDTNVILDVALRRSGLTVQESAARANWEDFDRIMARVPDAPPVPGDEK